MLESYTTLGYLAGVTSGSGSARSSPAITYRNLAQLAKIVATLDVVSGGRALCGLGAALVRARAPLYGWDFPPRRALRAPRGRARAAAADVGPGLAALRGPHHPVEGRPATRGRCRSPSRSWSAARASGGRCGSWRATPTRATSSATRTRCATSSRCCASTAPPRAATPPRSPSRTSRPPASSPPASRARGGRGDREEHVGRYRELAEAGVQTAIVGLADAAARVRDPVRRRHRSVPVTVPRTVAAGSRQRRASSPSPARATGWSACGRAAAGDSRRRSLVVVSDPAASDHLGPQRADAAARREFWARLNRLIDAVR